MTKPAVPKAVEHVVSRAEALEAIVKNSEEDKDPEKNFDLLESRAKSVEIVGREKYFGLRDNWSTIIMVWISTLIIFNVVLTVLVGMGWLSYPNLQWFITAVLVETFLQIVGLGYIAVKYLFSDKS